jgi:hypothetical protein
VGGGFAVGFVGQRPDLIDDNRADPVMRVVVLVLLAVDGVLCAVAAALLLPSYIGAVWFPISAVIAGLVNAALVWAAMQWTASGRLAAVPLITWMLTVVALVLGGPGGDIMLGGAGIAANGPVLLMVLGAIPPAWLLSRRNRQPIRPTT